MMTLPFNRVSRKLGLLSSLLKNYRQPCCWGFFQHAARLLLLGGLLFVDNLPATPPSFSVPPEIQPNPSNPNGPPPPLPDFFSGLARSNSLLGDLGGLRPAISKYGLSLSILETSEVLGNVTGGLKPGFKYDGLTQMVLQMDTQRAFDWHGGTFNVSGLQLHGRNLSEENLGTLQTSSGIEGDRSTRLWELWYQQKFLNEDRMDVKIGQQSLDQEFMVSQNALLFVNTMFGWPMVPSDDLPGGGPAYPLSALGFRVRARPTDSITLLGGVFSGSPVSNNNGDPQIQNQTGTTFSLDGGALIIGELQYTYPSLGSLVYSQESQLLSGTYKIGFWYDTENFNDQRYDNTGLSLANLSSSGIPETHRGDYSIYGVVDQLLWSDPKDEDADRTLSLFGRAMGTPQQDRNLIDFSLNAGLTFHEPIPGRGDDTAGIGMGYAKVSDQASDLDRDTAFYSGSFYPVRNSETFMEVTYQYELTPWCQLQPDIQYIFNPGGGIQNPNYPDQKVKDALVLGVRTNILF